MAPRPGWRERCEAIGFGWHSIDGVYWDESAAYAFSLAQIETLEQASAELHAMGLDLVADLVRSGDVARYRLPEDALALICDSWQRDEPDLFGRFDFSWNGTGAPRLLEYNADTPTSLPETSVAQWFWLQDVMPEADQYNALHEKLLARWAGLAQGQTVHFLANDSEEDLGNLLYMLDVAEQAGVRTRLLPLPDLGHHRGLGRFVDERNLPVQRCFKLYPWEWLLQDEFGPLIGPAGLRPIEPAWKMLLSSKALLPLLWERHAGHPNLLAASFAPDLPLPCVRKPFSSREGQNIAILGAGRPLETPGPHAGEPAIWQAFAPLPVFDGSHTVLGCWMVGDEPAGLGIREDATAITRDTSRFVPHYIDD
jgi:glutathionylspermidine synthase